MRKHRGFSFLLVTKGNEDMKDKKHPKKHPEKRATQNGFFNSSLNPGTGQHTSTAGEVAKTIGTVALVSSVVYGIGRLLTGDYFLHVDVECMALGKHFEA